MAQLLVRNLEDDVKRRLKARAQQHGRSTEEEVREILRHAVMGEEEPSSRWGSASACCSRESDWKRRSPSCAVRPPVRLTSGDPAGHQRPLGLDAGDARACGASVVGRAARRVGVDDDHHGLRGPLRAGAPAVRPPAATAGSRVRSRNDRRSRRAGPGLRPASRRRRPAPWRPKAGCTGERSTSATCRSPASPLPGGRRSPPATFATSITSGSPSSIPGAT